MIVDSKKKTSFTIQVPSCELNYSVSKLSFNCPPGTGWKNVRCIKGSRYSQRVSLKLIHDVIILEASNTPLECIESSEKSSRCLKKIFHLNSYKKKSMRQKKKKKLQPANVPDFK